MQDEINSQIVALSIRTGKEMARITTRVLQAAIRKYLQDHKQRNPTLTHGKQTVGQLMEQNNQLITKHKRYKYLSDYDPKLAFDIEKYMSHKLVLKKDDPIEVVDIDLSEDELSN